MSDEQRLRLQMSGGRSAALLALALLALQAPRAGGQDGSCTEARGSLCLRCPGPSSAREAAAASALPFLQEFGATPLLDAHMGRLRDPSDPRQVATAFPTCDPYTTQCSLEGAGCAVLHYGDGCSAPRFAGRNQALSILAAVSIAAEGEEHFHSTLLAGPAAPALRLVQAMARAHAIRAFDTSSISWMVDGGSTARGFSDVVVAGRWVYYIPGCYSGYAGGADLCRTVVRYDTLCASAEGWVSADCYDAVDLADVLPFSFKNRINFATAVYDGARYLYLISGIGDDMKPPVAAFVRYDTSVPLRSGTSWRLVDAQQRTADSAGSFTGGASDGRYIYLAPGPAWSVLLSGSPTSSVEGSGRVLRYDTWAGGASPGNTAPGDSSSYWYGWAFFEAGQSLHADCQRFSGAVYDGNRYVYFVRPLPTAVNTHITGCSQPAVVAGAFGAFEDHAVRHQARSCLG